MDSSSFPSETKKGELQKDHWMEIRIRKIRETSFFQSNETFHVPPDNPTKQFFLGWKSTHGAASTTYYTKYYLTNNSLRVGIVLEIYKNK